jgi:L-lactate dehydrogenase complex protein LldG
MIERFVASATGNGCRVCGPLAHADAAERVVTTVTQHALTGEVALPLGDPILDALELPTRVAAAGIRVLRPDAPDWDERLAVAPVGVTASCCAVAATGTVAVRAGPGAPRATSLLPPVHVCVVRTGDVVDELEDAIARVAADALPSALIWIGGPSRTADLEMKPTIGVHGPKIVELIVVDED